MKKTFIFIALFSLLFSNLSLALERKKGQTWNEQLIFRKNLVAQGSAIPAASNILLDYTVKNGTVYTATQNRSQAVSRGTELSTVTDFYVDWFWFHCGQFRTVTAYSPSVDGDGTVIGLFTLDSAFDADPATGANVRLINPVGVDDEVNRTVIQSSPDGQIQIGRNAQIGVIHDNDGQGGFVEYTVKDESLRAFPLIAKPVKTDSVNVSKFCFIFNPGLSTRQEPFIEKLGIHLDSVPADTKMRISMLGDDELDDRYPVVENVTLDQFAQGLGSPISVSTYADESTWNLTQLSDPTVILFSENYRLVYSFSDGSGDPRSLDVPVDTSFTDSPFWRTVRTDNIQSASGTSVILDTNASSRDDDYNGMRLYIDDIEFRDITDYDGTTKVATVDGTFTSPPNPNDPYDIKIAFLTPLAVFEYKDTLKKQVQNRHNRTDLSYSNDGDELQIGTVNYVSTLGGAPTFTVPRQGIGYLDGWFNIIDDEENFFASNVTISFNDRFEGVDAGDYVLNEKGVESKFRYTDLSFGWTVDKVYPTTGSTIIDTTDSPYTLLSTDNTVHVDTSNGEVTINMPSTRNGRRVIFVNAGDKDIIFSPVGAELIDGENENKLFGRIVLDLTYIDLKGWF